MLMISSTPRITYKMGMRAGLGAVEDKSLPWFVLGAPSIEVAAEFTGIYRILMGRREAGAENRELCRYQSTGQNRRLALVWQGNASNAGRRSVVLHPERFAFAAAGH
jgi:hypothetical protein